MDFSITLIVSNGVIGYSITININQRPSFLETELSQNNRTDF